MLSFSFPRWCSHVHRRQVDAWPWQCSYSFFLGGREWISNRLVKHEENFTSMWLDIHDQSWKARKNDETLLRCTPRKTYVEPKNWWVCRWFLLFQQGFLSGSLAQFSGMYQQFLAAFLRSINFHSKGWTSDFGLRKPRRRCKVSPGLLLQALHFGCSLVWARIAWGLHYSLVEIGEMKAKIDRSTRILFSPRTLGQWSNLTNIF